MRTSSGRSKSPRGTSITTTIYNKTRICPNKYLCIYQLFKLPQTHFGRPLPLTVIVYYRHDNKSLCFSKRSCCHVNCDYYTCLSYLVLTLQMECIQKNNKFINCITRYLVYLNIFTYGQWHQYICSAVFKVVLIKGEFGMFYVALYRTDIALHSCKILSVNRPTSLLYCQLHRNVNVATVCNIGIEQGALLFLFFKKHYIKRPANVEIQVTDIDSEGGTGIAP